MPGETSGAAVPAYAIQDPQVDEYGMPPLFDAGNGLLMTEAPSHLSTGKQELPGGGEIGIITIRTATTTLTLPLAKAAVKEWMDTFVHLYGALSESKLAVASKRGLITGR